MSKLEPMDFIGKMYKTNNSGNCFIVDFINAYDITVMFEDGYYTKVLKGNLDKGKVKNPFHKNNLVRGVGRFDSSSVGKDKDILKIMNLWNNVLQRCYCEKFHERQPTYKNVVVCESWLTYSKFEEDILAMENVNKFLNENWALDKDLIKIGNKVYSKDTCCFVPKSLNSKLSSIENCLEDGKGVRKLPHGTYRVMLSHSHIGCFKTYEEAVIVSRKVKIAHILKVVDEHKGLVDERALNGVVSFLSKVSESNNLNSID